MRYIVLGMHKSGTTLISNMLHQSGIDMVDEVLESSYDDGNKFERTSFLLINTALLDIEISKPSWSITERITSPKVKDKTIESLVKSSINNLNGKHENWGFKDPRTCLTYSYWKKHLGEHFIIGVYRPSFEVLNHYISKQSFGNYRLLLIYRVLKAWYIYNTSMLDSLRESKGILLSYSNFMANPNSVNILSGLLSKELKDLRNSTLKRSNTKSTISQKFVQRILKYFNQMDLDTLEQDLNKIDIFAT